MCSQQIKMELLLLNFHQIMYHSVANSKTIILFYVLRGHNMRMMVLPLKHFITLKALINPLYQKVEVLQLRQ
jgi:hypothetical protein